MPVDQESRFSKSQIVILSSIEWDATWQRHQIFASQWAAAGHEVFFVENTGFRNPSPGDLPRLWKKALQLLSGRTSSPHPALPSNLHIVNPLVLPPTWKGFRRLNAFLLVPRLIEELRVLGLQSAPVAVAYLPTATTLEILRHLCPSLTVYDCVDNFHGLPSPPKDLSEMEGALLAESALVLTTSRTLYQDKSRLHRKVLELHHGVSPEFFIAPPNGGSFRRLCYFGTLWHALDYEPVRALAEAGFAVDLIGPQKEAPPPLPGARLRGPISYHSLPQTLASSDVLILPYTQSEYNRGVVPAKIYECLATGRPVVASPLPALEPFGDLVYRARTPREWVETVKNLPKTETEERRRARLSLARDYTHEKVFARLTAEVRWAWEERQGDSPLEARLAPHKPGKHLMAFLRGFTWIGFLYGFAKASTLLTQVAAGRWLGPLDYGKANLAIAAAAYLQILPMMGFPLALSKFIASEPQESEKSKIISTTLLTFLLWAGLWLALLTTGHDLMARKLGIGGALLTLSVAFAYFTAFYVVISSPLLGLKRFDHRGVSEALYGLSAPLILLAFMTRGRPTYEAMILTLCLSLGLGSLYSLWALRGYLKPVFDPRAFRLIFRYALVATLNLLAVACVLGPARLILHRYDSPREVGIFSAYFTSTAQISLALLYMLSAVLVPLASNPEGQRETWRSFKRLCIPLWLGAWSLFALSASLALSLFGRKYPFHWEWACLFATAAALILVHGIVAALYSARDFEGLCASVTGSLVAGLGNVGLGLILIPSLGITGAALALVGAYLLGLLAYAVYALRSKPPATA